MKSLGWGLNPIRKKRKKYPSSLSPSRRDASKKAAVYKPGKGPGIVKTLLKKIGRLVLADIFRSYSSNYNSSVGTKQVKIESLETDPHIHRLLI